MKLYDLHFRVAAIYRIITLKKENKWTNWTVQSYLGMMVAKREKLQI